MASVIIVLVSFALGFLLNRWWAVLIPIVVWPLYMLGVHQEWWGSGVGDAWEYALMFVMLIGAAAVALGVGLRRLFASGRPRTKPTV